MAPPRRSLTQHSNGNITALIYPNQQLAAKYLYDPFGNTLAMSGPLMNFNKYRFSSKEWNDSSGLCYYLYRFYDASLQRWLNRDPFQNTTEHNSYEFVGDQPISQWDYRGLLLSATGGTPHISFIEHHNYLKFNITCPFGTIFQYDHVSYDGVAAGLAAAGISDADIATANGNFGGPVPGYPEGANCCGNPVKMRVFMRSRFADPLWFYVFFEDSYASEDFAADEFDSPEFQQATELSQKAVAAYVANTVVYYSCISCTTDVGNL